MLDEVESRGFEHGQLCLTDITDAAVTEYFDIANRSELLLCRTGLHGGAFYDLDDNYPEGFGGSVAILDASTDIWDVCSRAIEYAGGCDGLALMCTDSSYDWLEIFNILNSPVSSCGDRIKEDLPRCSTARSL